MFLEVQQQAEAILAEYDFKEYKGLIPEFRHEYRNPSFW